MSLQSIHSSTPFFSYFINGETNITRKSEYDYLWTCDSNSKSGENTGNDCPYGERINFLNNQ